MYVKLLIALIAIIDVPGNIPVFLQQTTKMTRAGQLSTGLVAAVTTAAILLAFAFFGETILDAFGVTIEAFKIFGGLVILLIALKGHCCVFPSIGWHAARVYQTALPNPPLSHTIPPAADCETVGSSNGQDIHWDRYLRTWKRFEFGAKMELR